MSIGYFDDVADADTYFEDERLETWAWDDLEALSGYKAKVLIQAYNRIYYDPRWNLPTYAEASATTLVELSKANAEMAYYLAVHLENGAEDKRMGLQAQGVTTAGVVKEQYSEKHLMDLPVPPLVMAILKPWSNESFAGVLKISRDDDDDITL